MLSAAGACRGAPSPGPLDPRPVHVVERWTARDAQRVLGSVVLLEIEDAAGPVRLYRVENDSGQWLGWVDAQGRVFQRVPFEDDDLFRGVYPMEKGLALLYEVPSPVRLERKAQAAEASGTPDRSPDR